MQENRKKDKGLILAVALLVIAILMLFFPYFKLDNIRLGGFHLTIPDYDKLGAFISGVTAPFLSLAAFVLLYLTYKSQKEELADSKNILKEQNLTQQTQRFETTFFNLLNLHHSIVNSIDLEIKEKQVDVSKGTHWDEMEIRKGRDCFRTFYSGFKTAYKRQKDSSPRIESTNLVENAELTIVKKAYNNFFEKHYYDLGHYFRNLYHLIKFIDKSGIDNKQMYVSLVRAQLSSHELLLIFYNCVSDHGKKFKPYMTTYHFLKNMPIEHLTEKSHKSFYDDAAYKS